MTITTKDLIEQISKLNLDVKFELIEIKLENADDAKALVALYTSAWIEIPS